MAINDPYASAPAAKSAGIVDPYAPAAAAAAETPSVGADIATGAKNTARMAVKGAAALPVVAYDVAGALENLGLKMAGSDQRAPRGEDMVEAGLQKVGLGAPQSKTGRIEEAAGSGAISALTGAGLAAQGEKLAVALGRPVVAKIMGALSEKPAVQAASGASGSASASAVREQGGGPIPQFLAGMAGGALPFIPGARARVNDAAAHTDTAGKVLQDVTQDRLAPASGGGPYEQLSQLSTKATAEDIAGATRAQQKAAGARTAADVANRLDTPADVVSAGDSLQRATRARVEEIKKTAQAETQGLLDRAHAEAEAKEKTGNLADGSGIKALIDRNRDLGSIPIGEAKAQSTIADYLFPQPKAAPKSAPAAGNPNVLGAPSFLQKFGVKSAPAAKAPTDKTTFAKLQAAEKTVQNDMGNYMPGTKEFATRKELLTAIQNAAKEHSPAIAEYKDAYKAAMKPANDILEPGNDASNAVKLQAYIESGLTGSALRDFEMAPEKVTDAFMQSGNRGGQKIKLILGDQAEPFVRNDMARRVQGMDAAQLRQFTADHETFLREFPETQKALHDVENQQRTAEGLERQAQQSIEQTAGREILKKPEETKLAMQGWINTNNAKKLTEAADLIRERGGTPAMGRDAVAQWMAGKLNPVLKGGAEETMTPENVSAGIQGAFKDWNDRKGLLVESGLISGHHANDIDEVMDSLNAFAGGTKSPIRMAFGSTARAQSRLHRLAVDVAAYHVFGYPGVLAERFGSAVLGLRDAYQRGVQRVMEQTIQDPQMAHDIAMRLANAPDKQKVLSEAIARAYGVQQARTGGAQEEAAAVGDVNSGISNAVNRVLH